MSASAALRCAVPATAAAAAASRNNGSSCSTSSSTPTTKTSPRISSSSRRRLLVVTRAKKAEKGGFGKGESSKQKASVKLSKRGTIATRGGQMSKKELEQQREVFAAIEQGREPAAGALPPSLLAPGAEEGRLPPSSTSTPLGRQQSTSGPDFNSEPEMREVSPVVTSRMFHRILAFSGVPIVAGVALFPAFYYLKKVVDVPTWVVYLVQSVAWGGGLAGISYGILSSSWDPNREGTMLGGDEFRANLGAILERGREKR